MAVTTEQPAVERPRPTPGDKGVALFRGKAPYWALALLAYIPVLLTKPGTVSADTKAYLYLSPGRLLAKTPYLWDPQTAMGGVPHQQVGYLFPMAPYYWLMNQVGLPTWVAQRIWLGTVLFAAGAGVVYLVRAVFNWRGPGVWVAGFAYMLSPYLLDYVAKHSVIAVPWSGLPWLIAFSALAVRRGGWRYPALFAITVQLIGGVNATSLVFVLVGALLWFPFAVWVHREATLRQAIGALLRTVALTFVTSLWWIAGLWAQGKYGIDILKYTETAKTVASASTATEVLRGLGYWFFYGTDKFGNMVDAGVPYTQHLWLLGTSFLIPILALLAASMVRFRARAFSAALVFLGTFMAVGANPWSHPPLLGEVWRRFLTSSKAGGAMRSTPRAVPLLVLGLAIFLGAAVTAAHERFREVSTARQWRFAPALDPRVALTSIALVALTIINFPALFNGDLIASGLQRPENVPNYWKQDAAALNAGSHASRVLEIPGSDFASYRWNGQVATTVDPITPGLMDRDYVAREQVPYGTPQSANLLVAFDEQMQTYMLQPQAVAPIARLMSAGDVNVRNDLTYERYMLPRPPLLWSFLQQAPGLGTPQTFGGPRKGGTDPRFPLLDETTLGAPTDLPDPPTLAILPVQGAPNEVRAQPAASPLVVAGDGTGLVNAANAGLINGKELVLYSASYAKKQSALSRQVKNGATLLLTDSNRKRAERWGGLSDNFGYTEDSKEKPALNDPSDNRLNVFPDARTSSQTVNEQHGGVFAQASSYGNDVSYTPEDRATNAIDGDINTAWTTGGFGPVAGQWIQFTYPKQQTADQIRLLQPTGGVNNRWITQVGLRFDNGPVIKENLTKASRRGNGQVVHFPVKKFKKLQVRVLHDNIGRSTNYKHDSRVGFEEITVGTGSVHHSDDVVRLPTDLLHTAGAASRTDPLDVLLTRERVNPANPLRSDPEKALVRTFDLPTARSFAITGTARFNTTASDSVIDELAGVPSAAHGGITATSSRHLSGDLNTRALDAVDGNPASYWSTGFLKSIGDHLDYTVAKPVTFDHMNLQIVADPRHSVPTKLRISADGKSVDVNVPPVKQQTAVNAVVTVPVTLPHALSGKHISVTITGQHSTITNDWYAEGPVEMPIAIAELGIPGLHANTLTGQLNPECRTDLLTVNGRPVPIALHGTIQAALDGKPIPFTACTGSSGVSLPAGQQTLRSSVGYVSGINLDQLVMRSAGGGRADFSTGLIDPSSANGGTTSVSASQAKAPTVTPVSTAARTNASAATTPTVRVTHRGRTSINLSVTKPATTQQPFWLVLGQSVDDGWHATIGGHDLGPPTLVNGYSNGWLVTPAILSKVGVKPGTTSFTAHLTWTPQRVVWVAIGLSGLGMVLCLFLALLPGLRRRRAEAGADGGRAGAGHAVLGAAMAGGTGTATVAGNGAVAAGPKAASAETSDGDAIPLQPRFVHLFRYAGEQPSVLTAVTVGVGAFVVFGAIIGFPTGAIVGILSGIATRWRKGRGLLTIGSPAALAIAAIAVIGGQFLYRPTADFNWPVLYGGVNPVAWAAVALLVMDVIVSRLWRRRW